MKRKRNAGEPKIDWAAVHAAMHPRVWWGSASLNAGWGKPVKPAAPTLEEATRAAL